MKGDHIEGDTEGAVSSDVSQEDVNFNASVTNSVVCQELTAQKQVDGKLKEKSANKGTMPILRAMQKPHLLSTIKASE